MNDVRLLEGASNKNSGLLFVGGVTRCDFRVSLSPNLRQSVEASPRNFTDDKNRQTNEAPSETACREQRGLPRPGDYTHLNVFTLARWLPFGLVVHAYTITETEEIDT